MNKLETFISLNKAENFEESQKEEIMKEFKSAEAKRYPEMDPMYSKDNITDMINTLENVKFCNKMIQDNTYVVYRLESGITGGCSPECSLWFLNHKYFVVKKNEKDGMIAFVPVQSVLDSSWGDYWVTSPATSVIKKGDYCLIEDDASIRYNIIRCGSICTI